MKKLIKNKVKTIHPAFSLLHDKCKLNHWWKTGLVEIRNSRHLKSLIFFVTNDPDESGVWAHPNKSNLPLFFGSFTK